MFNLKWDVAVAWLGIRWGPEGTWESCDTKRCANLRNRLHYLWATARAVITAICRNRTWSDTELQQTDSTMLTMLRRMLAPRRTDGYHFCERKKGQHDQRTRTWAHGISNLGLGIYIHIYMYIYILIYIYIYWYIPICGDGVGMWTEGPPRASQKPWRAEHPLI